MLDVELQRRAKRHGIDDVPAVRGHAGADAGAIGDRDAGVEPRRDAEAPRVVEVVLGARALDVRLRDAIGVEAFVALAEPAGLVLDDAEDRADVVPAPAHREDLVRPARLGWQRLPVARVEIRGTRRQRGTFFQSTWK